MKLIILKRILRVENTIKTLLAYNFSEKYVHENYMKMENFNYKPRYAKSIKHVMDLITGVQGIIVKQVDNHESIKHYMIEYGYVPLWVLVNILKNLTYCRNKCAHGERLYNFMLSAEIRE